MYDIEKDTILSTEHGPTGGDEINLIKKIKVTAGLQYQRKDPQVISADHLLNNYEEPIYFGKQILVSHKL